ncbi:type II toxin-antitoxin system Phd/YefM family antitoxin, partial [Mesorhizobium sp. M7A.T.Ca.TU.009.01.1.2]
THTVLLSAAMFEVLVKGRVARNAEELDDETLNAIAESAVPSEYAGLDAMLKDWTP